MYSKKGHESLLTYCLIPADIDEPVQRQTWPKAARDDPYGYARTTFDGWPEVVYCGDEDGPWNDVMMFVDEEGKLKQHQRFNLRASILYGFFQHGNFLVGDALLVGKTHTGEAKNLDRKRYAGLEPYFATIIEREFDHYMQGVIASRYHPRPVGIFRHGR